MQHGLLMRSQHFDVNTLPSSTEAGVVVDASDEHVRTVGVVDAMDCNEYWVAYALVLQHVHAPR